MHKQKIIFRVDGSSEIGLGHITRCCALADMLKDNFKIYFYTRTKSKTILENVREYCTDIYVMNDTVSYEEEAASWITALNSDEIVILDGYNFNTSYQQKIKEKGSKLVCIDDIHTYHFVADAVINHAPGIDATQYSLEPYTQLYSGTDYVLLKKLFLEEALNQNKDIDVKQSSVIICLGGADPNNITKEVLEETMNLLPSKNINVVVGAAYRHLLSLQKICSLNANISLHINIKPEEMLLLMKQSHLAITSASTIALEYICVKGNLFLKCIADNQKDLYKWLIEKNCAYSFEMLKEKDLPDKIIANQFKLIDGKSEERLQKIFKELSFKKDDSLRFEIAQNKDANLLFEWINDSEVRAQSLSTNIISYSEHINWFSKKLINKYCYLYIAYKNNIPAGMIRFDIHADECEISYLVDASQRGKGIGAAIINCGIKQFKKESGFSGWLKATVKNTNAASLKIFENSEFEEENTDTGIVSFKNFIA